MGSEMCIRDRVLREVASRIAALEFVDVPTATPAALVDGSLSDRITLLS